MQISKGGAFFVSALLVTGALSAGPQEDLKKAVTQVLKTLDSKKSVKEKRSIISGIYNENFDLEKMASNTLKSEYKKLDDGEKKQFAQKFGKFVLEFYLDKIDKYNRNKVEFVGDETKGNRAVVKTLLEYQGKMANVNYFMTEKEGRWMVYDFEVEGVRLSSTYRSQFAKVLKEQGSEGLSRELDKLLAKYRK
ncbi:MAG TPA: ABC transporter substrate-binding protein [Turneriella sp.]|nr:ABC transporter substrate-binding protein [Turneriella sp.]HNL55738.1 ABC transporter substrate-binding protein [Turneriella sp.]HNM99968.1 ABC transporter substrate-binding protein [Turneriella sp.]